MINSIKGFFIRQFYKIFYSDTILILSEYNKPYGWIIKVYQYNYIKSLGNVYFKKIN